MQIQKIRPVKTPTRGTTVAAGLDFYVPDDFNGGKKLFLMPSEDINIPSGIKVRVPQGCALIAFNKSGVATKQHLNVGACVVDEDYHGEVHLHVFNVGNIAAAIEPGQKLMQFVLIPVLYDLVEEVPQLELDFSARGEGGFGSTGLT